MYKELYFNMYSIESYSQRFKSMFDLEVIEKLFHFMQAEAQVNAMIAITKFKRPALEGIIESLEASFPRSETYDLLNNMRCRQITGSIARYIMGQYGYLPGQAKSMKKGRYIRSAIVYKK